MELLKNSNFCQCISNIYTNAYHISQFLLLNKYLLAPVPKPWPLDPGPKSLAPSPWPQALTPSPGPYVRFCNFKLILKVLQYYHCQGIIIIVIVMASGDRFNFHPCQRKMFTYLTVFFAAKDTNWFQ